MEYFSQANQDRWVIGILGSKKNGVFVDIGAYDGIQTSNTYTMEKYLDWSGICVEANRGIYEKLKTSRKSVNVNAAVSNYNGVCGFLGDKINDSNGSDTVECFTLDKVLLDNNSPKEIDYLSIDVEGHEYEIFKTFNFSGWNIKLMTVEHNLYCDGDSKKNKLHELLITKGFTRIVEDAVCLDSIPAYFEQPYEDWYINTEFYNSLSDELKSITKLQSKEKTMYG
jgi:FkbM family methyltransferase